MAWFRKHPFLLFILPGFLIYSVFAVYPIFSAVQLSLFHWDGIGAKTFVGFDNYVELFTNRNLLTQFTNALQNSIIIFLLNTIVLLPIQIFMAYMIYSHVRGFRFFQSMIFSPQFISTPVIVFLGTLMLDGNIGVVNNVMSSLGFGEYTRYWMGIPELGIYIVWLLAAWAGIGVGMILLLGAMKMISDDMIEAALLDGASYWRRLFSVVLPQIKTTILNLIVLIYIFSMTVFDFSFILGGVSGGINRSIDVLSLFFYRIAFGDNSAVGGTLNTNAMGMGTTIACVMFALIFIVALLQVTITYRNIEEG